ncbi:MAG: hypothetical protein K6T76_03385 [Alicyclobacillus mali]|uniref:hypothetical protein n=1 Tax=Alicyclobacillus mali (ex Roth et al. 2021) TaxID=1123961 RepID=UPI0023F44164|nr:hypothetical protein [Alicyclobacillus mali (ex Roth et al. 2021)]MCL6487969.1 hypothetical protein [Alicyclobacillus mali (ex Roth et al. 2021)]
MLLAVFLELALRFRTNIVEFVRRLSVVVNVVVQRLVAFLNILAVIERRALLHDAHNGSLVPVPGRDIIVQAWYQGGISVVDFTDIDHPFEIAYFDRGPIDPKTLILGGDWSAYWYNGHIYGAEIVRGIDVFRLTPSEHLSQNEIDAANLARMDEFNAQHQPRIVWPAAFPVPRAYLDQLERNRGLAADRIAAARQALDRAQRAPGPAAATALADLARQLEAAAVSAGDPPRVRALAAAIRDLAATMR